MPKTNPTLSMRLNKRNWWQDDDGLVLALSALVLPVMLLVAHLLVAGGQLYERQAQLHFMARQAANSGLLLVSEKLQQAAIVSYQQQCASLPVPEWCSSTDWKSYLTPESASLLINQVELRQLVQAEVKRFATQSDPKHLLEESFVEVVFPAPETTSGQVVVAVKIDEKITSWQLSLFPAASLQVQARSFLSLL